ncbi:MAG: tetratricopeptide repeat protein, partial [Gammaproteobacteria bacterium]|nr:tetratricopeptide repeat protein [Gammaproteobacteria bacterium]
MTPHRDRLDQAIRHLQAGRLPEAETLCLEILGADPGCAEAHHLLADVHTRRGDPVRAAASLAYAIQSAPARADLHMSLATVQMNAGHCAAAAESYAAAARLK